MADDKDGKLDVEARSYLSSCRGFRSDRKVMEGRGGGETPRNAGSPISGRLLRFRG